MKLLLQLRVRAVLLASESFSFGRVSLRKIGKRRGSSLAVFVIFLACVVSFQNCSRSFEVSSQQEASITPQPVGPSGEVVYTWVGKSWSSCSVQCGGGTQSRSISCQNSSGKVVEEGLCSQPKPATSQSCQTQACDSYVWVESGYSPCSKSCGGGTQTQAVTCNSSTGKVFADSMCSGNKPSTSRSCNTQACVTYAWVQSGYGACSKSCGGGVQTQTVTCASSSGQSVSDLMCSGAKPGISQSCNPQSCTLACSIANGIGTQTWSGSGYGACLVAGCNGGFVKSGESCVPLVSKVSNARGSHLKYLGYWDDDGFLMRPDLFNTVKDHGNVLLMHARYNAGWAAVNDFENFLSSPFAGSQHEIIIFLDVYSQHLHKWPWVHADGLPNLPEDDYTREKIERTVKFLRGDYTAGVPMWDRVAAIIVADEPSGPNNATLSVPNEALDWMVSQMRSRMATILPSGKNVPLAINYYIDISVSPGDWSLHVPSGLDWVATDPYIYAQPGVPYAHSDFNANAVAGFNKIKSLAGGRPMILVSPSYSNVQASLPLSDPRFTNTGPNGCTNDAPWVEVTRSLNATEESWYYDLARNDPQVIGLLWWSYIPKSNWSTTATNGICSRFVGSASQDAGIANLHRQWNLENQ